MKKKTTKSARNPRSLANLRPPWEKGTSGNPTGRPKDDAGEIARKIFERNAKAIYDAMLKSLMRGDPRVYRSRRSRLWQSYSAAYFLRFRCRASRLFCNYSVR